MNLPLVFPLVFVALTAVQAVYVLDDSSGLGRRFDGIGGLSAGAVRRLLIATA
eukprot:m.53892 g.53892  ORF g.53892 m.53892 type:complete len:53 (+) comp34288_c0_seq5:26-184(+)